MISLKMSGMGDLSSHFRRTAGGCLSVHLPNLLILQGLEVLSVGGMKFALLN
jgi:hypothetical protein